MKRFIFSCLLLIASIVITKYLILSNFYLIVILVTIIHLLFSNGLKKSLQNIGDHFWEFAYIQDLLWNVFLQVPLNLLFCSFTKNYYLYGVPGETISSATGKNLLMGNTNVLVHLFAKVLDFALGKNHCINSIQNNL